MVKQLEREWNTVSEESYDYKDVPALLNFISN